MAALVALAIGLFGVHNLLPYLGLRYESCQTMYSGLRTSSFGNNHLFMPQVALSDVGSYFKSVRVKTPARQGSATAQAMAWLNEAGYYVNAETVRVLVHAMCTNGYPVQLAVQELDGTRLETQDACRVRRFSRPNAWIPVRLYLPATAHDQRHWDECQPWLPGK